MKSSSTEATLSADDALKFLQAIRLAAEKVGEDGAGRNGLVGYFCRIARKKPKLMMRMLERIMVHELNNEPDKVNRPVEEIAQILRKEALPGVRRDQ
jgi:hypothetical protein